MDNTVHLRSAPPRIAMQPRPAPADRLRLRQVREAFRASPAIVTFWRAELEADPSLTIAEIESAFASWWAVVLHPFWVGMDWEFHATLHTN